MLKRLELFGFKSFADKTVFEFGSGITGIVGPNGSGKSNVVDAIKWVLGEQSAKSLRGKEMADVIFNGSATRRGLGVAEATLVFDNAGRALPVDADEVQLTRRVYRSGEGEYLINKNPSRLRDFRELFLGTGAGTEAYSVIEQGKVDVLLQASTKDRRVIFEEAAGISRFKARKIEALRKLEHVEQNLLRLRDIVDEVEKQLRSVKLQAAKARRYKEHTERLRDLRLATGLADFHQFTVQLDEIERRSARVADEIRQQSSRCDSVDATLVQVQSLTEELDGQIRALESQSGDCRQEIARLESQVGYERAHARDLASQMDRLRGQWAEFSNRVGELQQHITGIRAEVDRVEVQCAARRAAVSDEAAAVERLRQETDGARHELSEAHNRLMDAVQSASSLHNELTSLESQEKTLRAQRQRLTIRCESLAGPIAELERQCEALASEESSRSSDREALRARLNQIEEELEELWLVERQLGDESSEMREQRCGIAARIDVLAELERRHEGLATGVQQLLSRPEVAPNIVGLVADLLPVDLAHAAVIERALGDRAQFVVVRSRSESLAAIARSAAELRGRVTLLALDTLPAAPPVPPPHLAQLPGFVAIAAAWVQPRDGLDALALQLLGDTVVVRSLADALQLAEQLGGRFRFVTDQGEVLEADGTVTLGGCRDVGGLVSRKSQLRALADEAESADRRIADCEARLEELARRQGVLEGDRKAYDEQLAAAADQAARLANQLAQRRQQRAGLEEELRLRRGEIAAIDQELSELADQRVATQTQLIDTDQQQRDIEHAIHDLENLVARGADECEERQGALTASKVELAKAEGQLSGLKQRLAALEADIEDRQGVLAETQRQISSAIDSQRDCQRKVLRASSQIALLFLQKERLARDVAARGARRDQFRRQRQSLGAESQTSREQLQALQTDHHARQLEATEIRHQRATLVERLREDYECDLPRLYESYQPETTLDRDAVQHEIQELRRKIAGLGNVNLEALAELQDLETRSTTLQAQVTDLNQSKATLDEIIHKINQDSQRLFTETLEMIRGHFGELFRKLFGGGRADIILENEADVLESGIEIVARPPGKELRSLSLLSGGEKTLTTVALLMAVFRSKPSPFCILDEVDAALDEANIERFTTLLREFSRQAQFIMITHSKKSMVCVDVLYGVTMQESGVSKRVSVRFEDVNEEGEISSAAIDRAQADEPPAPPASSEPEAA